MGVSSRLAALILLVAAAVTAVAAQDRVNPDAAALADYKARLKSYVDLRAKASTDLASLKPGLTQAEVVVAEKALAERIQLARAGAQQGDIFTPAVVPMFKRVFAEYNERRTGRERRLAFDEVPDFKPRVNEAYPPGLPKATFPPRISLALPQLPDGLEYRLVGTELVLRDLNANLIVDWIPNVTSMPATSGPRK